MHACIAFLFAEVISIQSGEEEYNACQFAPRHTRLSVPSFVPDLFKVASSSNMASKHVTNFVETSDVSNECALVLHPAIGHREGQAKLNLKFGHEQAVLHACKYASVCADSVSNGSSGNALTCSSKPSHGH